MRVMSRTNFSDSDVYLGDGAFFHTDGFSICLYTNDGIKITNQVWLEPLHVKQLLHQINVIRQSEAAS